MVYQLIKTLTALESQRVEKLLLLNTGIIQHFRNYLCEQIKMKIKAASSDEGPRTPLRRAKSNTQIWRNGVRGPS